MPQKRRKTFRGNNMPRERATYTVTVCSACRRASCWQGKWYCEDYKTAGTAQETRSALTILDLEAKHYWTPEAQNG